MHVVFVHGWSVRNIDTYGDLPQYLRQQAAAADIVKAIRPNETLMVEIVLRRKVDRNVFTLSDDLSRPQADFKATPSGNEL